MQSNGMEWEIGLQGAPQVRGRCFRALAVAGLLCVMAAQAQAQSCQIDANCNDGNPCTIDRCVGIFGMCSNVSNCSDGQFCNGLEACCTAPGGCGGTPFGFCGTGLTPCAGLCNDTLDACVECLSNFNCEDFNDCTDDVCNPDGSCSNNPNAAACSDGNACTTGDICVTGVCTGVPIDCDAQAGPCEIATCNAVTGGCEFSPKPNGSLCSDNNLCTAVDSCVGGQCVGGTAGGCIRLEMRGPITPIRVGDYVELELWMVNNGCPLPPVGLCSLNNGRPVAGLEAAISWDSTLLALAPPPVDCAGITGPDDNFNSIPDPCENPGDPCVSLDPCVVDCGSPVAHNWSGNGSSFPNDCGLDGLNFPCPGFPQNDGDALVLAFKEIVCNLVQAPPACVGANGLLVTRLKFRALKATAGVSTGATVGVADCIGQTRTKVAGAITPGIDDLGTIGPPASVVIECVIDADCPIATQCSGGICGSAPPPTVEVVGPRYLDITPQIGSTDVAILVTGVDPSVACVSAYVRADGVLGPTPFFQAPGPAGWGTVHVRGTDLVSSRTYNVQIDTNPASPGTSLTNPVSATLWAWGDVDNQRGVDILDVTKIIDGFQGTRDSVVPCATDIDCTQVPPSFECNLATGFCVWVTVENVDLRGALNCLPEQVIDIVDITSSIDAFGGRPVFCVGTCP